MSMLIKYELFKRKMSWVSYPDSSQPPMIPTGQSGGVVNVVITSNKWTCKLLHRIKAFWLIENEKCGQIKVNIAFTLAMYVCNFHLSTLPTFKTLTRRYLIETLQIFARKCEFY